MRKWPRILFFINGSIPSDEETAEAESLGFNVVFRNGLFVAAEGALEACDGVAGEVPERYAAAYPSAEEVVEEFKAGVFVKKTNEVTEKVTSGKKQKETKSAAPVTPVLNPTAAWTPNT